MNIAVTHLPIDLLSIALTGVSILVSLLSLIAFVILTIKLKDEAQRGVDIQAEMQVFAERQTNIQVEMQMFAKRQMNMMSHQTLLGYRNITIQDMDKLTESLIIIQKVLWKVSTLEKLKFGNSLSEPEGYVPELDIAGMETLHFTIRKYLSQQEFEMAIQFLTEYSDIAYAVIGDGIIRDSPSAVSCEADFHKKIAEIKRSGQQLMYNCVEKIDELQKRIVGLDFQISQLSTQI